MKIISAHHYVDELGRRISIQRNESDNLYHLVITSDHAEAIDQIEAVFQSSVASTVPTSGTKQ